MPRYNPIHLGPPFNEAPTFNQMNDQAMAVANAQSISVSEPLTIENTPGAGTRIGIILPPPVPAAPAAEPAIMVRQFRIRGTSGEAPSDVILCRTFLNGVTGDSDIWVARNWFARGGDTWLNQPIPRGGIEYSGYNRNQSERTATKTVGEEVTTERQKIIPSYFVGDRILAIRVDVGLIQPDSDPPEPVEWADLNVDARMWAEL